MLSLLQFYHICLKYWFSCEWLLQHTLQFCSASWGPFPMLPFPPIAHSHRKLKTSKHIYWDSNIQPSSWMNQLCLYVRAWHCLALRTLFFPDSCLCETVPPGSSVHHKPLLLQRFFLIYCQKLKDMKHKASAAATAKLQKSGSRQYDQSQWNNRIFMICQGKQRIWTKHEHSYFPLWSNLYILVHKHHIRK